jgi:ABC-type amino acid transport substrate-binding protein
MPIRSSILSVYLLALLSMAAKAVEEPIGQALSASCEEPMMIAALNYPPFFDENETSDYVLKNAVVDALAMHGCRSVVVHMPFARALQLAKMRKVDAVLSVWYRPSRERFLHYGPKLFSAYNVIATLDKPNAPSSINELDGLRLGIVRGYALPTELDLSNLQLIYTRDDRASVAMLEKGRVDAVFINDAQLDYWPTTDISNSEWTLKALPDSKQKEGFYFAVTHKRADHVAINAHLVEGLKRLNWNGGEFAEQYLPALPQTNSED